MKRWEVYYSKSERFTRMSYWVHTGVGEKETGHSSCKEFIPPMPREIPNKGFPKLIIYALGGSFTFASMQELDRFIAVFSQKNMPTTIQLSRQRGTSVGPNTHWLSRFPGKYKPWRKREKLIKIFEKVKQEIEAQQTDFYPG